MTKVFASIIVFASFVFLACNTSNTVNSTTDNNSLSANDSATPVETRPPNSTYKPAVTGQTRIAGVKTKTPYEGKIITSDLKNPWGIAVLPDGRFLITQKAGTMRIVSANGQLSDEITGLLAVANQGQGGLLGITLDPEFEKNKMVYWSFSEPQPENHTAIAKGKLSADEKTIEGATVIYRAAPYHNSVLHYGGRIVFDKTGNLIISTGERSDLETRPRAQDLNAALGKLIRITKDGQAAPGNPFVGRADARPEIYTYGHRNVQGLAFNPQTGDLWECEFGPLGGDELNLIKPGSNYGWPTITYGLEYSGKTIGQGITQKEGMEQPVYYWDPVLSPSGMTFYTGDNMPEWKNNLFIGGLSSQHIARLVIKDNKVVGEEMILSNEGQRFRDVVQGKDGALYAVTDAGRLYRIGKK
jgi:aldose sugar dehydrogenase